MALSTEAGWNQVPEDWELVIRAGHAVGLKSERGDLEGTTVSLEYGARYGWLAMVLVAKSHRRQGLGSYLFEYGLQRLRAGELIPALDATPAGEQLYSQYGFRTLYRIHRMSQPGELHGTESSASLESTRPSDTGRPNEESSETLREVDREVTRFDRREILEDLRGRSESRLFTHGDQRRNVALLRRGNRAWHIGPVYAEDDRTALELIDAALRSLGPQAIYIDVETSHDEVLAHLDSLGFERQRPFARMVEGGNDPSEPPRRLIATAGPEYG